MRNTKEITIATGDKKNRDEGHTFWLTEMSAADAEEWAMRLFLSITRAGIDVPAEVINGGMAGVAAVIPGIMMGALLNGVGSLNYDEIKPLLDQMMDCVQRKEDLATRALTPDDIEEVSTRLFLRGEVFKLHTNFSQAAGQPA